MLSQDGKRNSMFCKINYFSGSFCVCLSVLTLVAVTYDRYLSIKRPLKYPMLMTKRKVYGIIAIIWGASSIYLPVAVFFVESSKRQLNNGCTIVQEGLSALIILFVYIPITFIFLFNYKTWRIAHGQRRSIARNTVMDSNAESINFSKRIAKELKAVKTFGMILGVLTFCFTPYALTVLFHLLHFNAGFPPLAYALFADLVGLNSVLNPLIYGLRQKKYRKELYKFFDRLCC
ncbi:beta-1 adrenergic receptor-like [Dendronephthya gigantea]|uniref:beta-1 adrenergic receptor-like n=1 Tax=Dendronephthya gigantea TaxID=151771 RepID=UPI00106A7D9E|nr:beta-1 adrenergic receptor-like [Dendronephthya gigantea]